MSMQQGTPKPGTQTADYLDLQELQFSRQL